MSDLNTTIDRWFAALNDTDPDGRAAHVAEAFADDGAWVDPPFQGQGHDAINALLANVSEHYPGARFRRVSAIDAHHDAVRYGWEMVDADGNVVIAGTDIGQVAPDGRLQRVSGFFGPLPEHAAA